MENVLSKTWETRSKDLYKLAIPLHMRCIARIVTGVNCNAFLDHLLFSMPFHQILESYLIVLQKGLVTQLVIYC